MLVLTLLYSPSVRIGQDFVFALLAVVLAAGSGRGVRRWRTAGLGVAVVLLVVEERRLGVLGRGRPHHHGSEAYCLIKRFE